MIEVKNITKYYGPVKAVDNISFEVKKGEILGLLGPNAAGKTTTMRILTCFMPPTNGTATVAGYNVLDDSLKVRGEIGYLPENAPLYPEMTVTSYLSFWAQIQRIPRKKRKESIKNVLESCNLGSVQKSVIGRLSKGFKQRVGLAQALLHDPQVLILDEPTVGLDPKQILETREVIKNLTGQRTVILSTHILPEVSMTCQRVIIMNNGKLVAGDTPDNLTRQLRKSQQLHIEVRGPADKIKEKLNGLEHITRIEIKKGTHSDSCILLVDSQVDEDIRSQTAEAIINSGWQLLELRSLEMSLEEIFLKLTTHEEGI